MTSLVKLAVTVRGAVEDAVFARATRSPARAQDQVLRALLRRNADTAFGREHGFAAIRGAADYARRVPVRDYEAFRPYVDRVVAREARVLTADDPFMFTATSGTTGEPKLIPVTREWAARTAGLMRLWAFHALRDHPALFDRGILTVVSPAVEGTTAGGLPFGAMSGLMYQRLPWLARRRHVLPYPVALIRDYEARYFVTMRLALPRTLSSIGTANPSTLLRMARVVSARADALVGAIRDGTLGLPIGELAAGDGGLARALCAVQARLRPAPDRARELETRLIRDGGVRLDRCWPDLALVGCWLGGNAGIQARRLGEHYGTVPVRDLGLVASEGRLTVPVDDHTAAGVLAVHASFFEFVPEERIEDPAPPVALAHELEAGRRYYVLLSGSNGLYRYDLNDVVEVTGFHHRTPLVAFVRKGRDMLSITGEKLHLNHVLAAIGEAERRTRLAVGQFRLVPDLGRMRYDLLLEPASPAAPDSAPEDFADAFDAALAGANAEYAAKRRSGRLDPPALHLMERGWAERVCRAELGAGTREAQHKWRALCAEWDVESRRGVARTVTGRAAPPSRTV